MPLFTFDETLLECLAKYNSIGVVNEEWIYEIESSMWFDQNSISKCCQYIIEGINSRQWNIAMHGLTI